MAFLTDEKLVIVGAGGMIGSNMVQSVLMLGLTPNICLYDIYEPGVHGVYDEMCHCAFPGANISYTVDAKEAFTGAKYIISSGGAPRKEGMTREDLLKGNCQIAADFGENIKKYCPDVKHVVVIQLAQEFGVRQDKVTNAYTYGGHGEQMAVFASKALIDGKPLSELPLSDERWAEIKHMTTQGGSNIIKLRGRSSFQSPAYQAVKMIEGAMGGEPFKWPAGCYVNAYGFKNVMMAMPTVIDKDGVHFTQPEGTAEEMAALQASYEHLQKMRDEIISLGIIPAVEEWGKDNANL